MKLKASIAALLLIAVAVMIGTPPWEPVQNLRYQVIPDSMAGEGGAIKLEWEPQYYQSSSSNNGGFFSCDKQKEEVEYVIYVDDKEIGRTDSFFYYVYTATKVIGVSGVLGESESHRETIDLAIVETPYLEVWSINDPSPEHPSGFGFIENGTATAYSTFNNSDQVDIYLGIDAENTPCFISPHIHPPNPLNTEHNSTCQIRAIYDSLKIVPAPTNEYFKYETPIQNNGVYGFWLDDDGVYDTTGHFGKIYVTALTEPSSIYQATLKLGYQLVSGLRWVVTSP